MKPIPRWVPYAGEPDDSPAVRRWHKVQGVVGAVAATAMCVLALLHDYTWWTGPLVVLFVALGVAMVALMARVGR